MTEPNYGPLVDLLTPPRTWQPDGSSAVRLLGLAWIGAAGWTVGSDLAFVLGIGLAVVALIARPVTTVAVGHAALIVLVPELFSVESLVTLGLFEGGLLLLLVSERPTSPVVAVLTVSGAAGLAATASLVAVTFGLAAASALTVGILAIGSVLLYWYEQRSVNRILDYRRATDDDSPQTTHT